MISFDMGYFLENWGGFASLFGVAISLLAAYSAWQARNAAREARRETRRAIRRDITTVDLQRAIALAQRLKELHRHNRWETCLEHYQPLRVTLSEVRARHPELTPELKDTLGNDILDIIVMENEVSAALGDNNQAVELLNAEATLNDIQATLESISSSLNTPEDLAS